MATYQLRRLQLLVRGEWVVVPIDRRTVFTLRLSGAGRFHHTQSRSPGYTGGWTISGIPLPPLDLAGVAPVEVTVETTAGDRWRGSASLHPDGDRLALVVAGELRPC